MAAASVAKSAQHLLERLVRGLPVATGETTLPVKDILTYVGATSNPPDFTSVANASAAASATFTATGVAVGDCVIGYGVVSGLATNQFVAGCYVSATDTITVIFVGPAATNVTTTATTMNFIVADVT